MTEVARTLDAADRRLLREMQQDASRSPEKLAEIVGMSASSIRRRLRRLRDVGVIIGQVALIDPALSGVHIVVAIVMRDEDRGAYDRLKRRLGSAVEVTQCYSVTGEVDLIVHVHMADIIKYEEWIDAHILADDAVRRCTSHVVYAQHKFTTETPLT